MLSNIVRKAGESRSGRLALVVGHERLDRIEVDRGRDVDPQLDSICSSRWSATDANQFAGSSRIFAEVRAEHLVEGGDGDGVNALHRGHRRAASRWPLLGHDGLSWCSSDSR